MKLSSRQRWALYAVAGLGTAAAMWQVDHAVPPAADAVQPARAAGAASAASAPLAGTSADPLAFLQNRHRAGPGTGTDPFADGASVAATGPVPAALAAGASAAAPAAPAPAPLPPFTYMGRWEENGETIIFLRGNNRVFEVRGVGALDDSYVVQAIAPDSITLKHLPMGEVQTIALARNDASTATPASAADAPAPARGQEEN
jgi:hypothetical protein